MTRKVMPQTATPYATNKLLYHPEKFKAMQRGENTPPLTVHLMWQNKCGQDCHFCAYRMSNWKNNEQFDDSQHIPFHILASTLYILKEMGVKGIELTGGGEPLMYPQRDTGLEMIHDMGFDIGLVTNGQAMTEKFAKRHADKFLWARVSIDAGKAKTYSKIRRVPERQFEQAFEAVRLLRKYGRDDLVLGVGYVVDVPSAAEVHICAVLAKQAGADNMRISLVFGPEGEAKYTDKVKAMAEGSIAIAKGFECDTFHIHNLFTERAANSLAPYQPYKRCPTIEYLCVIGGDSKVYSCCTLAFNPLGELGDLRKNTFAEIWEKTGKSRLGLDPSTYCKFPCLYEKRNQDMLVQLESPLPMLGPEPPHINFI